MVDPLAEMSPDLTPYRYGFNNPIRYFDIEGLYEGEEGSFHYESSDFYDVLAYFGIGADYSNGNNNNSEWDKGEGGEASLSEDFRTHTVAKGQNHRGITREYYNLFNWMDIQKLNPNIDIYNGGKPLPAGTVIKIPGPASTLGRGSFNTPGIPAGKFGGIFKILGLLILDTPHSPIYHDITPGQLSQNRAYYNIELGYFEWSWANSSQTILRVNNYEGYVRSRGTWRGVYQISTKLYHISGSEIKQM